ncbi:MAG: hypothetical protein MI922_29620, partial [Bacteroidales bacterium]|nr:hypothetical protein [Bacteroidales bacterium]
EAIDTNNNSLIDQIEWIVPHLSTQNFQIIIEITSAELLDENKNLLADVYENVSKIDEKGVWVSVGQYLRVRFESLLDKTKDITIYAKSTNTSSVEVYEKNSDELIMTLENIAEYKKYKKFLTNFNSSSDTFDLKVIGSPVYFDYVVDPAVFVGQASGNTNNGPSVVVDVSSIGIQDDDLILFFGSCDGTTGYNLPTGAGFTLLHDVNTAGTHNNILGYKIASSEPNSYTVDVGSGNERGIVIFAVYRGIDTANPIDQSNSNIGGSDTTAVVSPITPTNDNSIVAVFVGTESGTSSSPFVSSWPATLTEQLDNVNGPPGGGSASSSGAYAHVIQTTATTVSGNIDVSATGSTNWGTMAVSLNKAKEAPTLNSLVLNSSTGENTTINNLTCNAVGAVDFDGDPINYIYNWI